MLWVLVAFYVALYAIQYAYDYKITHSSDVNHKMWHDVANGNINADIVFIGNSRALVHYDPALFHDRLGYSAYVLGMDGEGFTSQKIIKDLYLTNNKAPKILFQNVDIASFAPVKTYNKPPHLPYISYKNVADFYAFNKDAYMEWLLPMYKYRYYASNYNKLFNNDNVTKVRGYQEMDIPWRGENKKKNPTLDKSRPMDGFDYKKGYDYLDELAQETLKSSTDLYLSWAPTYYERTARNQDKVTMLVNRFREFEKRYDHVHFLDFTRDSLTLDTIYFYNENHLNKKGVQIFNEEVIDSIIRIQESK